MGANGPDATKATREGGMEAGHHQARPRRCGPVTSPAARPFPGGPGRADGIEPVARRQARGRGSGRLPRPLPSSALLRAPSSPGGPRKAHPAMVRGHGARRETSDSASRHRLEAQGTAPKWMIWPGCRVLRRSAGCRSTEFQAVTWSFAAAICRAHRPLRQINPWGPSGFRASSR